VTDIAFVDDYFSETVDIISKLDRSTVDAVATRLGAVRDAGGRLFVLGVGGYAGHASHPVNDFRKICGLEAYSPTDNLSELTARINDDGWDTALSAWLEGSHLGAHDAVLVFSVGGGNAELGVSTSLVRALDLAKSVGASICGVVGRDGGNTARVADACVVIPVVNGERITPHTEGLCAVVWHLFVTHPALKTTETKWESIP
jgi:D-sedoheptulose 7-phosphate isomerase